MWVTCHDCKATGFIPKTLINNPQGYYQKIPCKTCNPQRILLDNLMKGQIWVEDNYEPVSPPLSPR
jgi:hypothetical protein